MARRKRTFSAFNLSFLDIMACGFGATILLFLIIDHNRQQYGGANTNEVTEARLVVAEHSSELDKVHARLQTLQQENTVRTLQTSALLSAIRDTQESIKKAEQAKREITMEVSRLQTEVAEQGAAAIASKQDQPDRFITNEGRQYLSGLKTDGRRVLILVDTSASMLDKTIVNIIRRRNMSDAQKRIAPKWQRAVRALEWLQTQLRSATKFQIYTFSTKAEPALADTAGKWIDFEQGDRFGEAVQAVGKLIPKGGTDLLKAFRITAAMNPPPDSLILLTDSLPTQSGRKPQGNKVSGAGRLRHFVRAVKELPRQLAINIILFPMEGDPRAAGAYWELAFSTQGSFISPAEDWP